MKVTTHPAGRLLAQFFGLGSRQARPARPARWTPAERLFLPLAALLIAIPFGLQVLGVAAAPTVVGLDLTKSASASSVSPGDALDFSIDVANSQPGEVSGVRVDDPLPAQVSFVSVSAPGWNASCGLSGTTVRCTGGTLAAGEARTITISARVNANATGAISNVASAIYTGGPQQSSNTVTVQVTSPTATPEPPSATPAPPTAAPTDTPPAGPSPSSTPRPLPTMPTIPAPPSFTPAPGLPTDTPVPGLATNTPAPGPAATDTPVPPPPPPPPAPGGGKPGGGGATGGRITGAVTNAGQAAGAVPVELRRAGSGADVIVATAQTDSSGAYHFDNQPDSGANAVYYVRYPGGLGGTLATWATYGQTYAAGAAMSFPGFDIADVQVGGPAQGAALALPATLSWSRRNGADSYIVRIFSGETQVLDSNELGAAESYTLPAGVLGPGAYTAVLKVRQPNLGYGEAHNRFTFTVTGAAPAPTNTPASAPAPPPPPPPAPATTPTSAPPPPPPAPAATQPAPAPTTSIQSLFDVRLFTAADRADAAPGETVRYTIVLLNAGTGTATNARVVDQAPAGLLVDLPRSSTSAGTIDLRGQTFTAAIGTIKPGERITVTLSAGVIADAGSRLANQARLTYDESPAPLASNSVELRVVGPAAPQVTPTARVNSVILSPTAKAQPTTRAVAAAPTKRAAAAAPTKAPARTATATTQSTTIPKTGGEFPILGFFLGLAMLLTRQLRLRTQRAPVER
jgi:uncharacterized repeat protein (TIGR01451 family)